MISNGELWLPEWVSWQRLNNDGNGGITLGLPVKVWLADASLRRQFPDYDIAILTPLARLDDFFLPKEDVKAKLAERGYAKMFSDLAELTAAAPYTVSVAQEYDWVDRIDRDYKLNTVWVVGVGGEAGKSPDVIREELVDYILKHSNHPRSDWEEILPELFISTEFIIVPNWEQYAIENQTELFAKKKSLEMAHGVMGFRTGTPKLKTLKGFTWASALQLTKEFLPGYVRLTEELAKDKMLADREAMVTTDEDPLGAGKSMIEMMAKCGIQVVQDETFYVEPKREEAV